MWRVIIKKTVLKSVEEFPANVAESFRFLVHEIEVSGPMRYNWKNFSKLKGYGERYHCHIKSGRPTFVVCWEVTDKEIRIIEVYYAGTHENAPYR